MHKSIKQNHSEVLGKGEHLISADDAREKNAVGLHWERASNGRGLFLMAQKKDADGRDVTGQINFKLGAY